MGFYEDDRIRNKNRHFNEAADIYQNLLDMGYNQADVIAYANHAIQTSTDTNRNNIYHAVVQIAGVLNEDTKD